MIAFRMPPLKNDDQQFEKWNIKEIKSCLTSISNNWTIILVGFFATALVIISVAYSLRTLYRLCRYRVKQPDIHTFFSLRDQDRFSGVTSWKFDPPETDNDISPLTTQNKRPSLFYTDACNNT